MIAIETAEQQAEPWSNPTGGYDPWSTDTYATGSFGAPYPAGSGTGGSSATFTLYPSYVYKNEPFAIAVGGDATTPTFGAYLDGGSQVGQLFINGSWTTSGYNAFPTPLPTAATARLVSVVTPPINIRLKVDGVNTDTKTVTGLSTGYGYLQGTVTGGVGEIVAASKNGVVLGTAQIDSTSQVNIAVKEDVGITLSLYGNDGTFKNDLTGTYDVVNGQVTQITGGTPPPTGMSVADALNEINGTEVTVTGYIIEDLNGIYAIKVADTNDPLAQSIAVKLEASMRDQFSPLNNPSALGSKILVTGIRDDYMQLPSIENVSSIEFVSSPPPPPPPAGLSVADALNEVNGTEVTVTGYIIDDLNGIYAIKAADTNDPLAQFIAVKLEASMRGQFSPLNNPSALGSKILVTGIRDDYM